jgi:UPF0755 protein
MQKVKAKLVIPVLLLLFAAPIAGYLWVSEGIEPVTENPNPQYVRFDRPTSLTSAIDRLAREGYLRNATATKAWARLRNFPAQVRAGTYQMDASLPADVLLKGLQTPIRQMVRLPEQNWARRTANLLQKAQVCTAEEYLKEVANPAKYAPDYPFPLPADTLEGYLYPDTYDLPPLLGAEGVVRRQLDNFRRRVWEGLDQPKDLRRTLIIASLVELEAKFDRDRPLIAGVIENRLKRGMRLQVDASLNYGIQKWRPLTYADYRNIPGPYNLYRVDGLPPTPICSPSLKSIEAARNPASHDDLFYVALDDGTTLYGRDYDEHLRNVRYQRAVRAQSAR